ncbi:sarcosine oxidase [Arthrobacter crystallopoietes BAB-32]|uniref:Sarcosine oxidase n=1 Tax=Arthrobacter crystallopoietes BAB-32 TaxID=1246476 RepID=N1VCF8_9MICC|nr:N-methyl-L-tryptophan oxidase [Arthrobacter crystallopoietes]EMY35978.1 sarcosine oxidase [Arthrobacter crystallopoietes BAB-32]
MYDAIVIGAGLTGSSAAWALSRRGRSVLLLEANDLNHTLGSSHGTSRIFRTALASPLYAAMAGRAQRLWTELEDESGTGLLRYTGALDFGEARRPGELHRAVVANNVACELLSPEAAQERWPFFRFPTQVLFHPQAGVVNPEAAIRAMLSVATGRYGAEVRTNTRVLKAREDSDGVHVETDGGTFRARSLIVAAGPWLPEILPEILTEAPQPEVRVTEQNVFHFRQSRAGDEWPVFVYKGHAQLFGLPSGGDAGPEPAIKVGRHDPGKRVTPSHRDGVPTEENRELITRFVEEWLPGLEPRSIRGDACLYTTTSNDDFILDRIGRTVVASPCSGQGAKFMPAVGEAIADLATENAPTEEAFALMAHAQL